MSAQIYKTCCRCGIEKPIGSYGKDQTTKDKHRPECRECRNIALRRYTLNPIVQKYRKDRHQLRTYGISIAIKEKMLEEQGGCCPICGTNKPGKKGWATDHDHISKKIRGILCQHCNQGLGNFLDNKTYLLNAVAYIAKYSNDT